MAHETGRQGSDLTEHADSVLRMDFFQLLRLLEREGARFGRAGGPGSEPARLGQSPRLVFAASDVAEVKRGVDGRPPEVAVNVLGLIGPEGPMPLHMTRWIMERMSNRWFAGDTSGATADTSFLNFINMIQHRHIALYWRAWADARADVQVGHAGGGSVSAMMRAMSGIGLPGTASGDRRLDNGKLRQATALVQQVQSPGRLSAFLSTVLELPVIIREFTGHWITLPSHLQTRLGQAHAGLGRGAVAGARVFDRQSRAEIRVGPLSFADFKAFLDDNATWQRLRRAVIFAEGKGVDYDLRLVLAPGEVPAARLGSARLGRTAWLAPDLSRGADDMCFARITGPDRRVRS
ncbi:type VI secretion system baseplate subunit TssG [Ruegeria marina]|uniref:Type VI secretion system protein ImpH n=1 Tax=Ruegeria marina TaxID=639004 RepID=A0A1G7CWY4_9RHOB|nr:type VI secretion system baseplate subunit TssG [Ruegeria marina]SDE43808.1 type VI secretion system protein ImpH [Ruegeria marina]